MPERFTRTARAAPPGVPPPVGRSQSTSRPARVASTRHLPPRLCLRKGCGCVYQPRRGNQRYCQKPECLAEVQRWQNAQRQQRHRQCPQVREQRAADARQRRQTRANATPHPPPPAKPSPADGAWSRRRKNSAPFCHRPGCYEPLPADTLAPARYCGHTCCRAMRRVLNRERKWLRRKTGVGRRKRRRKYRTRPAARGTRVVTSRPPASTPRQRPP